MSSCILRHAALAARQVSRTRGFASSAVTRADIIQDLYLREIKGHKPAHKAKDAHIGAVKQFALPPTPSAPTLPANLAAELSSYDAAEPTGAAAASTQSSDAASESVGGTDAFLSFLEQDVVKPAPH